MWLKQNKKKGWALKLIHRDEREEKKEREQVED